MSEEEINAALVSVMIRTLDSWFIMSPELTHDAVAAWLESIECEEVEPVATDPDWPETFPYEQR